MIAGATKPEQIAQNAAAGNGWRPSAAETEEIEGLFPPELKSNQCPTSGPMTRAASEARPVMRSSASAMHGEHPGVGAGEAQRLRLPGRASGG